MISLKWYLEENDCYNVCFTFRNFLRKRLLLNSTKKAYMYIFKFLMYLLKSPIETIGTQISLQSDNKIERRDVGDVK